MLKSNRYILTTILYFSRIVFLSCGTLTNNMLNLLSVLILTIHNQAVFLDKLPPCIVAAIWALLPLFGTCGSSHIHTSETGIKSRATHDLYD